MSGPKTASYRLTESLLSVTELMASGKEAVEHSWNRLVQERRKIVEEREKRFSEQLAVLKQRELQWRADKLYKEGHTLLGEIRTAQAGYPDLVDVSFELAAPPLAASVSTLDDYITVISGAVATARGKMESARAKISERRVLDSWTGDPRQSGGHPRAAGDVLSGIDSSSDTPDAVVLESGIDALRENVSDATRQFLERHHIALPEIIGEQVRALYETDDASAATGLGAAIRHGLMQAEASVEREHIEARKLLHALEGLPNSDPRLQSACERLEAVLSGKDQLTDTLRKTVESIRRAIATQARERDERAAGILRSALEDLGYEVEPIAETLFVDGGTIHFRKPDWEGSYAVRLRVDPRRDMLNFNMIRVSDDESSDRGIQQKQDIAMENSWCKEFDRMQSVIHDRGIDTKVTRRVNAGALPVLKIGPESVNPEFLDNLNRRGCNATSSAQVAPRERRKRNE